MKEQVPGEYPTTTRLRFRRWTGEDAQFVLEMYSLKDVYQYLGSNPAPLEDISKAEASIQRWNDRTFGPQGFWAVVPKSGAFAGTPIGAALLLPLQRSDGLPSEDFEIGWHFHPKVWGNGFATEAAFGLINRAKSFGLSEVYAVVYPANTKSLAVCDRLGMVRIGETDQWYKTTLIDHLLVL